MSEEFAEIESFHRRSETCASLFAALAAAQGKMEGADRDAANPHFRSRYATLASVIDAQREPLAENKLCVIQIPGNLGDNVAVTTILGHASGEWLESTVYVAPLKFDAQGLGSAVTYLCRYARMAIIGTAPEDDDGEAAVARPTAVPLTATKANPAMETADKDAARRAYAGLKAAIETVANPESARALYDGEHWGEPYRAAAALVAQASPPSLAILERRLKQLASPEPPETETAPTPEPRRRGRPRRSNPVIETPPEPDPAEPDHPELDPAPDEEPPDYDAAGDPEEMLPPVSVHVLFEPTDAPQEWFGRARTRLNEMLHAEAPPDRYAAFRKANFAPLLRLRQEYSSYWRQLDGLIKMGEQ